MSINIKSSLKFVIIGTIWNNTILSIKAHFCVWVRNSSGLLFLAVVMESKASSKIEMQ